MTMMMICSATKKLLIQMEVSFAPFWEPYREKMFRLSMLLTLLFLL